MKNTIKSILAAGAFSALSISSTAQAQSVDTLTAVPVLGDVITILVSPDAAAGGDSGLSLLDPNSIPVVGDVVGVLLDTGGVDLLAGLADTSSLPVIGTLLAGSNTGDGASGLFGIIPVAGPILEPIAMPLFAALNPDTLGAFGAAGAGGAGFSPEDGFALGINLSNLANDPANGILFGNPDDVQIHSQTVGLALLDQAVVDVAVLGDIAGAGLPIGSIPVLGELGDLGSLVGAEGEGLQLTVNLLAAAQDPTNLIGFGPAGTADIHQSTVGLELLGPGLLDVALLGDVLAVAGGGAGVGGDSPLAALPIGALPLDSIPVLGEVLGGLLGGQ